MWKFFETHPLFARPTRTLTMDEERHLATKRQFVFKNENFFNMDDVSKN